MNSIQLQLAVEEATKSKFRGKEKLKCRTVPRYPDTAEREFQRITNAYMKMVRDELKKELPALMREYTRERRGDSRFDDVRDLERLVKEMFMRIYRNLEQKIAAFGIAEKIQSIAKMTKNTSLREWKRAIHETLGINLIDDYYNAAFYEQYLKKWVDENVLKIKSIPSDTLGRMQEIILNGYRNGKPIRELQKEIQEEYDVSKSKARALARDQVSSLNAQISQAQQRDAGVKRYRWSTSHDSRVRDCHAEMDGKEFSWDDPPEMWYETKSRGRVYTGRRCHPGEDYLCRCCAIPVFEKSNLKIPMAGGK